MRNEGDVIKILRGPFILLHPLIYIYIYIYTVPLKIVQPLVEKKIASPSAKKRK